MIIPIMDINLHKFDYLNPDQKAFAYKYQYGETSFRLNIIPQDRLGTREQINNNMYRNINQIIRTFKSLKFIQQLILSNIDINNYLKNLDKSSNKTVLLNAFDSLNAIIKSFNCSHTIKNTVIHTSYGDFTLPLLIMKFIIGNDEYLLSPEITKITKDCSEFTITINFSKFLDKLVEIIQFVQIINNIYLNLIIQLLA